MRSTHPTPAWRPSPTPASYWSYHKAPPVPRHSTQALQGAVGCSVELREAHTFPSSTTLLPDSRCPGTARPWTPPAPRPQLEKGSLRRGAGKAASMSRSPKAQVFCSAANQTCPGTDLLQTLSPQPSPWLACRAQPGRRRSSLLIYFHNSPLGRLESKSLALRVSESPRVIISADGDLEGRDFHRSHGWGEGKDGAGEEPVLPSPLSSPAPSYCVCLSPGSARIPHHWALPHQWRERSYLVPQPQAAGLIPEMAFGAQHPALGCTL